MDTSVLEERELAFEEMEEGEISDEEESRGEMEDIEEEEEDERSDVMEDSGELNREGEMEDIEEEEEEEIDVEKIDEEEEKKENERGMGSRMTLRPHTEQTKPCPSSVPSSSEEMCLLNIPSSSSSLMPSGVGLPSSSTSTSTAGHRRKQWGIGDMLLVYEAVKQYGKDFDSLHRVMLKQKTDINKEQLRNFFFNFYKQVKMYSDMKEEDWPSDLSRDARELFIVINGCEWRKRMGNYKFEPLKLKALIMEGTTTVRVKTKNMTLKTPTCPALLNFFSFNRRITRFPPDIVLYLSPRRYKDGTNVLSRGQSRHLCIRLNTSDRVERIFELLQHKWKGETEEEDCEDEEEEEEREGGEERGGERPFTIRLYPSKHTLMGAVLFTPSTSSYGNVSLNMLHEDRSKVENIKRQFKKGEDIEDVCYKAAQSLIPHLTLSRNALLNGLTKEAAGSASIAELYAVCGLSRELVLLYSIEEEKEEREGGEDDDPFDILTSLICSGYGEATTDKKPGTVNKTPSRDDPMMMMDMEEEVNVQPQPKRPRMNPRPMQQLQQPRRRTHLTIQSPIVTKEMCDFEAQLRAMSSAPRPKRRSPVQALKAPSSKHKRTASFSHFPATPMYAAAAATAASTPSRSTTTFPPMSASGNDPMAMALRAALASPGNSLHEAPSTSYSPRRVPAAVFASPTKTQSTLPSDVRSSMEQMMSQNSVDYCMEFAQLIQCTTFDSSSPSKIARL